MAKDVKITFDERKNLEKLVQAMKMLNSRIPKTAIKKAGDRIAKRYTDELKKSTQSWQTKVKFSHKTRALKDGFEAEILVDNQIWFYVSLGTAPHKITAKSPDRPMIFQTGYKAKTNPNLLGSKPGGSYGPYIAAYHVHHPGIEARNFHEAAKDVIQKRGTEIIVEEILKEIGIFERLLYKAIR